MSIGRWAGLKVYSSGLVHRSAAERTDQPEHLIEVDGCSVDFRDSGFSDDTNVSKMGANLHDVSGGADRVVVLDTETTGLYNSDRVVEIALVTMSLDGEVVDRWETLIQPERDVSAGHIHGITASMVQDAPTFDEIAGDVAVRLHGACVAAHNLTFDKRMIANEFDRLGGSLVIGSGLDTLSATGLRLHDACEEHGDSPEGAHRAMTDAISELLLRVVGSCDGGSTPSAPRSHRDRPPKAKRRPGRRAEPPRLGT